MRAALCTQIYGAEIKSPGAFGCLGVSVGGGESDVFPPTPSLHPWTSSLVRGLASRCGLCLPRFAADTLTSPALRKHQRGHPGIGSELMRPPITFICFKDPYPAMTPHISEFPHLLPVPLEQVANYKKISPKEDT